MTMLSWLISRFSSPLDVTILGVNLNILVYEFILAIIPFDFSLSTVYHNPQGDTRKAFSAKLYFCVFAFFILLFLFPIFLFLEVWASIFLKLSSNSSNGPQKPLLKWLSRFIMKFN